MSTDIMFEVRNLHKHFKLGKKAALPAVDGVSFNIHAGETVSLVGESGSGKTTCGRTCIGLLNKTSGEVLFYGADVHTLRGSQKCAFNKSVQMVFQDSYSSLDPRMTVADIVAEGIDIHGLAKNRHERIERVYHYLSLVGLNKEHANRFAHEFSGGQRQRIGIARALAVEPEFILLDEPISALDVSIQAQIINLLIRLQRELGLTYLFVAHNLSVVKLISDRIAVLYLGQVVEIATADKLYQHPLHPYTQALLSAIPVPDPRLEAKRSSERIYLSETTLDVSLNTVGCKFRPRCPAATAYCAEHVPTLVDYEEGHSAACHLLSKPHGQQAPARTAPSMHNPSCALPDGTTTGGGNHAKRI
jgi:oligopeptide transport system ATP-binding protein